MAQRNRKPDPRQTSWIAEREATDGERFALVDAVTRRLLELAKDDPRRSGMTNHRWKNVAELLKRIHACSDAGVSHARRKTLAAALGWSPAKVDRAAADAGQLGLLEIEARYDAHGRTSSGWRIVWPAVAVVFSEQCSLSRCSSVIVSDPQIEPGGPQNELGDHQIDEGTKRNSSPVSSLNSSPPPNPPRARRTHGTSPPPCPPPEGEGSGGGSSRRGHVDLARGRFVDTGPAAPAADPASAWRVVVEEVFRLGVNQAKAAVDAARARGATAPAIRALCDWWQVHRDGFTHPEAVLYGRLKRFDRKLAAGEGWPAFRDGYVAPNEKRRRSQERYWRDLERRHGPTVTAWDEATKRAMAQEVVRREPELAGDGLAIYRRLCQYCETQTLAPSP